MVMDTARACEFPEALLHLTVHHAPGSPARSLRSALTARRPRLHLSQPDCQPQRLCVGSQAASVLALVLVVMVVMATAAAVAVPAHAMVPPWVAVCCRHARFAERQCCLRARSTRVLLILCISTSCSDSSSAGSVVTRL